LRATCERPLRPRGGLRRLPTQPHLSRGALLVDATTEDVCERVCLPLTETAGDSLAACLVRSEAVDPVTGVPLAAAPTIFISHAPNPTFRRWRSSATPRTAAWLHLERLVEGLRRNASCGTTFEPGTGDAFYLTSSGGLPDVLSLPCPTYVLPVEGVFGGVGVGLAVLAPAEGGGGGAGWAVRATPVGGGGGVPVKTTTNGCEHHHQLLGVWLPACQLCYGCAACERAVR